MAPDLSHLPVGPQLQQVIEEAEIAPALTVEEARDLLFATMLDLTNLHLANDPDLPVGQGRFGKLTAQASWAEFKRQNVANPYMNEVDMKIDAINRRPTVASTLIRHQISRIQSNFPRRFGVRSCELLASGLRGCEQSRSGDKQFASINLLQAKPNFGSGNRVGNAPLTRPSRG